MTDTALFFSAMFPEDSGYLEIRLFDDKKQGRPAKQVFFDLSKRSASDIADLLLEDVTDARDDNYGVFFGVCPRDTPGGTKNDITKAYALWADIDGYKGTGNRDKLDAFDLPPSAIVETSKGGLHAYWFLAEPCTALEAVQASRGIQQAIGSDPKVLDTPRVLRVPGCYHCKGEPVLVKLLHIDEDTFYLINEFTLVEDPNDTTIDPKDVSYIDAIPTECPVPEALDARTTLGKAWAAPTDDESKKSFALACQMLRQGLDPVTIAGALAWRYSQGAPNMPEFQVIRQTNRCVGAATGATGIGKPETRIHDDNSAVTLGRALAGDLPNAVNTNAYGPLAYDEDAGAWDIITKEDMERHAQGLHGELYHGAEDIKAVRLSDSQVRGIASCAIRELPKEDFEVTPAIHFTNGVLTQDGTLHDHNPDFHILTTATRDYAYTPSASTGLIEEYFESVGIDQDSIDYLQEWYGTALFGVAAHPRAMHPLLVGKQDSGKSSLLDALRETFPHDTVGSEELQDFDTTFGLENLIGKTVNIVDDLSARPFVGTGKLKSILTGGPVGIGIKGKTNRSNVILPLGVIIGANRLPHTSDKTDGFFKRFVVIRFTRSFQPHEMRPDFIEALKADHAGLIAWGVEGYKRFVARGRYFIEPQASVARKHTWKRDTDIVRCYVEDFLVVLDKDKVKRLDANQLIGRDVLYRAIREFAEHQGVRQNLTPSYISDRLEDMSIEAVRHYPSNRRCFTVAVKPTADRNFLPTNIKPGHLQAV